MDESWIEHRRGPDGELLGWMMPVDEGFVVVDLLGRHRTAIVDWLEAEETLEALGLSYLAGQYELLLDSGEWLRVRLTEVSTDEIRVKKDDWGAIDAPQLSYALPFPAPDTLRPLGG